MVREEETARSSMKMSQLRGIYGRNVRFNLFLCDYLDCGYLGYKAA